MRHIYSGFIQLCFIHIISIGYSIYFMRGSNWLKITTHLIHTRKKSAVMFLGTAGILTGGHCIKVTLKGG